VARYLVESRHWDALPPDVEPLLEGRYAGDVYLLLAAGMRALDQGDIATAENIEARLRDLKSEPTDGLKSYLQGQVTLEDLETSAAVAYLEIAALVRLAKGKEDEAVAFVEEAVEKEKEMHPAYGPPEPMVPPMELYGEVLLEAGRYDEAAEAFEAMMVRMPNRTRSILGAARTADAMGDVARAAEHYQRLAEIWSDSEETPRLKETRTYLNSKAE